MCAIHGRLRLFLFLPYGNPMAMGHANLLCSVPHFFVLWAMLIFSVLFEFRAMAPEESYLLPLIVPLKVPLILTPPKQIFFAPARAPRRLAGPIPGQCKEVF